MESDSDCIICRNDFQANDAVEADHTYALKCGHVFHKGCINVWLAQQHEIKTCPVCRHIVTVEPRNSHMQRIYLPGIRTTRAGSNESPPLDTSRVIYEIQSLIDHKMNNLANKMDEMVAQFGDRMDQKIASLVFVVEQVNKGVANVDKRIANLDKRVANVEKRVANADKRVANVEKRVANVEKIVVEEQRKRRRASENRAGSSAKDSDDDVIYINGDETYGSPAKMRCKAPPSRRNNVATTAAAASNGIIRLPHGSFMQPIIRLERLNLDIVEGQTVHVGAPDRRSPRVMTRSQTRALAIERELCNSLGRRRVEF